MESFVYILIMAVIVEGLITYANMIISPEGLNWKPIVAILLGIAICVGYGLDLLSTFGFASNIPYIGSVLTGVLLSRGSNYIADLINVLNNVKTGAKQEF